jgi:ceramide kinase
MKSLLKISFFVRQLCISLTSLVSFILNVDFFYAGIKMFFKNRGYLANIAILVNEETDKETKSPTHRQKCLENCDHCANFEAQKNDLDTHEDAGDIVENVFDRCDNKQNKRWKIISGKYFMVNVANISCGCKRSKNGIAPNCHLGDGYIDITLAKHTSFWNNLRLLMSLKSGDAVSIFAFCFTSNDSKFLSFLKSQFPFVENYRTRQFQFLKIEEKNNEVSNSPYLNPNSTDDSYSGSSSLANSTQQFGGHHFGNEQLKALWNCDGEPIDCSNLIVRSHFQLIKVFRRGGMRVDGKPSSGVLNESNSSDETLIRSICKCGL